jgi:tripartite motif-containing protein 2/3
MCVSRYVLVKVVSSDGGFVRDWTGDGLTNQSAVGLAVLPGPVKELLTLNWRAKTVTKWSSCGQEMQTVSFSEFVEPIDLAVDGRGRILVADNGACKVFVFDARFRPLFSFPVTMGEQSSQDKENAPVAGGAPRRSVVSPSGGQVTCVAVGMNEDILVGGASCVRLFDCSGKYVRTISVTPRQIGQKTLAPLIGGLAVDRLSGTVLTAVTEKNRTFVAVSHYKGDLDFTMDSFCAKLKRPSGVCLSSDRRHCYVADLGNHCIKKLRYK